MLPPSHLYTSVSRPTAPAAVPIDLVHRTSDSPSPELGHCWCDQAWQCRLLGQRLRVRWCTLDGKGEGLARSLRVAPKGFVDSL